MTQGAARMDNASVLVAAGLLRKASKKEEEVILSSRPFPGFLRDHFKDGKSLLPFLVLANCTGYHNVLNADGKLSISISTNKAVTRRVDALLDCFAAANKMITVVLFLPSGVHLGHAKQAHRRNTATAWRLELHQIASNTCFLRSLKRYLEEHEQQKQALCHT